MKPQNHWGESGIPDEDGADAQQTDAEVKS